MSDWLERELTRGLAPVEAPDALRIRLGLAPAKRWEYSRGVLAIAAAVMMIVGGGYAASRYSALDLHQASSRSARSRATVEIAAVNYSAGNPWPDRELASDRHRRFTDTHLTRCDSGASTSLHLTAGNATVLLAHAGTDVHANFVAADAGCHQCHNL